MLDSPDLGSGGGNPVPVEIRVSAPIKMDTFNYKAAKKFCDNLNNKLSYRAMKLCAERGQHKFGNYTKFNNCNLIGTCTVCGWKHVVDGNI